MEQLKFGKGYSSKPEVVSFVGLSGTGKSYRAQMVANEQNIEYIIDDGLFIKNNQVIAGSSAKKAPTKIETVKKALFSDLASKMDAKKAIAKYRPQSILILGTSDNMIEKIAENLGLPKISRKLYITDYATEEEMQTARRIRITEGKHVIPVPTFEIKKDFSGFLLDPLQIFKSKGKGNLPYIAEKSIIRPTFSYMGNFKISDTVFRQIIEYLGKKNPNIYKINKTRTEEDIAGIYVYVEIILIYGCNIRDVLLEFQEKCKKEIENLTAMNVEKIDIVGKGVYLEQ